MAEWFSKVNRSDVFRLLDEIDGYNDKSDRWQRCQFEKYLSSNKGIDSEDKSMFYGLFDGRRCLALCYLNKVPDGFILVAEVQCVVKGYGKVLLEHVFAKAHDCWLAADPTGGESLLAYYRQFGLKEFGMKKSKWCGVP